MIDKLIAFINRKITHSRDKDGDFGIRVLLHMPIGVLIGFLLIWYALAGIGLVLLFGLYEWCEDYRVQDHAWKDLFGALAGCTVGLLLGHVL